jgi:hypothetical protein
VRHLGLPLLLGLALALPAGAADEAFDPADFYRLNCAPCHGTDGRLSPDDPRYATFDPPPADLTDPLFNSREPAADWELVVSHGGARLGLSNQMPAYDFLVAEHVTALVAHLKTFAETDRYPPGDLNYLRPIDVIKPFPEDEALLLYRYEDDPDAGIGRRTTLYWARRFGTRYQGEVKAAYAERGSGGEWDEVELGFKAAVYSDLERALLVGTGLEVAIPIEDDDAPEEAIPYVSLAKGLGPSFTAQATLRSHLPTDGIDEGDVKLSGVVHWMRSPWPRSWAPGLEGTVTRPFHGDDDVEATVIPQIYVGMSKGGHVALAVGVELPVTGLDYDYRIRSFVLWDIADGPLWRGW